MAVLALELLIVRVLPWLATAAAGMVVASRLTGREMNLYFKLDEADRRAVFLESGMPISQVFPEVAAWLQANADYLGSYQAAVAETQATLAEPITTNILAEQGLNAAVLAETTRLNSQQQISLSSPPVFFPAFETFDQADQWLAAWNRLLLVGIYPPGTALVIRLHYDKELARLSAAAAPAIPVPVPAEPTFFPVPGFGRVGVSVAVSGGGAVPISIPSAPAIPAPTPVIVPAPIVTVFPPSVTVAAPPAPNVEVFPSIDTTPIGAALGTLPLALSGSLATAMSMSAGPNAHSAQQARYGCMSGFLGGLTNVLGSIGPQIATGIILSTDNPIRQALDGLIQRLITSQIDPAQFAPAETYDQAVDNASRRLLQAIGFAQQAQAISYTAEAMTPLKQMGFAQLAGFMGELAGFGRIAQGLMGTIEMEAIYRPLLHQAHDRFRSMIPGMGDLEEMYAKKEIPLNARKGILGLTEALARSGYSQDWIDVYKEYLWKDPRLGEVIRIGQFFSPALVEELRLPSAETARWMADAGIPERYIQSSDWYFAWRAAKGGYDPRDVAILTETAKRAVARREQTLFLDAITRMVRDGFLSLEDGDKLVIEGWEFFDPLAARRRAMELQRDYKLLNDTKAVVIMSMSRGLITRDEARDQLKGLGLDPQRVEMEVLKGTLGMLPGMRIQVSRPEEVLEEAGMEAE